MKSFSDIIDASRKRYAFWEEMAILTFTGNLLLKMEQKKISKKELAKRMGVSPSQITKFLEGGNNFTLKTMVTMAHHLGCELNISLTPAVAPEDAPPAACSTRAPGA